MHRQNPFGDPDGAHISLEDSVSPFIENDYGTFSSVITSQKVKDVRVVVGAKGAGKTMYLTKLSSFISESEPDAYVVLSGTELPSTDAVSNFSSIQPDLITERWTKLWKCAITRSLVSHILCSEKLNSLISDAEKTELRNYEGDDALFPHVKCTLDVYSEIKDVLKKNVTTHQIEKYIDQIGWDELDNLLCRVLSKLPDVIFLIDCADEEFHRSPRHWMWFQKGLFYRTIKNIRSEHYKKKFSVICSIRDQVFFEVLEDDRSKYVNSSNILYLKWDYCSIRSFFMKKIEELEPCYFVNNNAGKTIQNWVGICQIYNTSRGKREKIEEYIIRHTRLTPRDIVQIANQLSTIKRELSEVSLSQKKQHGIISQFIREKVIRESRNFGKELIKDSIVDFISKMQINPPQLNAVHKYENAPVSLFCNCVKALGTELLSWRQLCKLRKSIQLSFNEEYNVRVMPNVLFDILWQKGGIGYLEYNERGIDRECFFVDHSMTIELPQAKDNYVFSPCVRNYIET